MRILVFGQSATEGWGLDSPDQTWPALIAAADPSRELESVLFFAAGPRAIPFALREVARRTPDLVILSFNLYPCMVPTVAASVRHRFGERAWSAYLSLEERFNKTTFSPTRPRRANETVRLVARHTLGTRPIAEAADMSATYAGLLQELAVQEALRVVVVAEAEFGSGVRARLPGLAARIAEVQAPSRKVAAAHYFPWVDTDPEIERVGRDAHFLADGVHLSATGHALCARLIGAALVEA